MTVTDRIDVPTQLLGGARVPTPDGVHDGAWVQVSDGRTTAVACPAPSSSGVAKAGATSASATISAVKIPTARKRIARARARAPQRASRARA